MNTHTPKRRSEIVRVREENANLMQQTILGKEYREKAVFYQKPPTPGGKPQEVEVYIRSLGCGEIAQAFLNAGIPYEVVADEKAAREVGWANFLLQCEIVGLSMTTLDGQDFTSEWVKRYASFGSTGKLTDRILALSFTGGTTQEKVDKFPANQQTIQPTVEGVSA